MANSEKKSTWAKIKEQITVENVFKVAMAAGCGLVGGYCYGRGQEMGRFDQKAANGSK